MPFTSIVKQILTRYLERGGQFGFLDMSSSRGNTMSRDYINQGAREMKEGRYEEALSSFNRAIDLGDKSLLAMDAKAWAMSKLPVWVEHALERAEQMCQKWPKDFRPWYRKADILRERRQYASALACAKTAMSLVPLVKEGTQQGKVERLIEAIQREGRAAKRAEEAKAKEDAAIMQRLVDLRRRKAKETVDFTHLLSPDILVMIAQVAQETHPDVASRMERVCRRWRAVVGSEPALWKTLVFGVDSGRDGTIRPVSKAALWVKRSGGRLRKVHFKKKWDYDKLADVLDAIGDSWSGLQELCVDNQKAHAILRYLPRCRSLRRLEVLEGETHATIARDPRAFLSGLDLQLELRNVPALESLMIKGRSFLFAEDLFKDTKSDPRNKDTLLANLKELHLADATFFGLSAGWALFASAHNAQKIHLHQVNIAGPMPIPGRRTGSDDEQELFEMPNLRSYAQTKMADGLRFEDFSAPNLVHLDLWSSRPWRSGSTILDTVLAPGLAEALPNLQSLDIGKTTVYLAQLVDALGHLPSLRFLNVSACGLGNDFLEKLKRKDNGTEPLLPKLEALSIASSEITSAPLQEVVASRSGVRKTTSSQRSSQPTATQRSAFKPSSRQTQDTKDANLPAADILLPSSIGSSSLSFPTASSQPRLAVLRWLCVDHCEQLDPKIAKHLGEHLRFCSHWLGPPNEDRIRGKGRFAWDADWRDQCNRVGDDPCHLRQIPGSDDRWYVYHACQETVEEEDEADLDSAVEVANMRDHVPIPLKALVSSTANPSSSTAAKPIVPAKRRDGDAVAVKTKKQKGIIDVFAL